MRVTHPTNRGNYSLVWTENGIVAFSYETPVAVQTKDEEIFSRENEWGNTTAKHINMFGKGTVLTGEQFEAKLKELGL